jgi:type VII secretion protein EccB
MPQMRSRREQVEAHRFITSRMNQALVLANPDSIERPLRRIGLSIFVSVMVMALIFGGFAIATLFGKGNYPPELNHIIFEKDTNAIYVYTTQDGSDDKSKAKLWPVANYTSALLLLKPYEGTNVPTQTLKPTSLDGIPRGFPVGIAGAPPSPPPADSLLDDQDWNACSMPIENGSKPSHYLTQLVIQDLVGADPLGAERWMLAETAVADGETPSLYLLWNDYKFEINVTENTQVLDALGLNANDAVPVNQDVLNTVPTGAPLRANVEDYYGETSGVANAGSPIAYGQTIATGGKFYVLMRRDGVDQFAEVSPTEQALLVAATGLSTLDVESSVMTQTGAQASYGSDEFPFPQDILADDLWVSETDRSAVCVVFDPTLPDEEAKMTIGLFQSAPQVLTDAAKSVNMDGDGNYVSNVEGQTAQPVLPSGTASLVDAQSRPGQTIQGITYLVDSLGYRFGIVDEGTTDKTQNLLGYAGVDPVDVPQIMLDLIPQGADLDPQAARSQLDPQAEDMPEYDTGETGGEAAAEGGS